ncbi:MAG: hypothetical protein WD399_08070 [Thermoleophilaceae bacterium]
MTVESRNLALRREAAAAALSVSPDHFDRYIRPHLPVVHTGRVRLYPVVALERWLTDHAERPSKAVAA